MNRAEARTAAAKQSQSTLTESRSRISDSALLHANRQRLCTGFVPTAYQYSFARCADSQLLELEMRVKAHSTILGAMIWCYATHQSNIVLAGRTYSFFPQDGDTLYSTMTNSLQFNTPSDSIIQHEGLGPVTACRNVPRHMPVPCVVLDRQRLRELPVSRRPSSPTAEILVRSRRRAAAYAPAFGQRRLR